MRMRGGLGGKVDRGGHKAYGGFYTQTNTNFSTSEGNLQKIKKR